MTTLFAVFCGGQFVHHHFSRAKWKVDKLSSFHLFKNEMFTLNTSFCHVWWCSIQAPPLFKWSFCPLENGTRSKWPHSNEQLTG
jgi:hypothetical protein